MTILLKESLYFILKIDANPEYNLILSFPDRGVINTKALFKKFKKINWDKVTTKSVSQNLVEKSGENG